jgi:hypothetical protein
MIHPALDQGDGILRLAPTWVPRAFCIPGKRIKLHPADLYAFGAHRGGIDERWFSSTTRADNGPLTTPDEGLSYVIYGDAGNPQRELLADLVQQLGADLLGEELWAAHHGWPVYSKFFDNKGALPHHLHQMEEHAARVGQNSKPEAYYFPRQLNNYGADFPYTFFGMAPGTTASDIRHCLEIWDEGDNHITDLSTAYRLELGTGWYVPAGILHAPGSLCTYEPQWASDIFAFYQSLVNEVPMEWELVVKNVPADYKNDLDYIVSMVDLPANTNPNFKRDHFRKPVPVMPLDRMQDAGYTEHWITYGNPYFAAKELTIQPGRSATIRDSGPYGVVVVQGHGTMGVWPVEAPALIRFGQLTNDEYFVSFAAASAGVMITNPSTSDPLVMLKNFGPNPEASEVK